MKNNMYRKLVTGVLSAVMSLTLCLGTAATAFAASETPPSGTKDNPATAAITKVLQMPKGTTTPSATFSFKIDKVSVDGDTTEASLKDMPALSGSVTMASSSTEVVTGDVKTVTLNTGDLFAGKIWPHAGVYTYKVTENADTYTITDAALETMTYSKSEYELCVYVAEADDGTLYVKSAIAYDKKEDDGTGGGNEKIDPSKPEQPSGSNNFKFTNTYVKRTSDPTDPPTPNNQSMVISKQVAGALASKSKEFTFNVLLKDNSLVAVDGGNKYTAKICTLSGGAYTQVAGTSDITFTAGTAQNVNLKHGQYLVFTGLPVGTTYTATEAAAVGYAPAAHVVVNGTAISPDLGGTTVTNVELSTGTRDIGEGTNSAAYTNTYVSTVPTGILMNNMPFIVLLFAAGAAFAGVIVSKRRRIRR